MPKQRNILYGIHGAVAIIFDRLDLDLSPTHLEFGARRVMSARGEVAVKTSNVSCGNTMRDGLCRALFRRASGVTVSQLAAHGRGEKDAGAAREECCTLVERRRHRAEMQTQSRSRSFPLLGKSVQKRLCGEDAMKNGWKRARGDGMFDDVEEFLKIEIYGFLGEDEKENYS